MSLPSSLLPFKGDRTGVQICPPGHRGWALEFFVVVLTVLVPGLVELVTSESAVVGFCTATKPVVDSVVVCEVDVLE